ncbi:MAG: hypothetical protein ACON4R_16320 [Akkermansiaceae bacterium]
MKHLCYSLLIMALLCSLSRADNIASSGTGIIGLHTVIDDTLGLPYIRNDQPDGTTVRMTDGTIGTDGNFDAVIDTWNGDPAPTGTFAYYGVTGLTIPEGQEITNLTVNLITANDGGWFGPNGTGPGNGGALDATHLTEPTIQVTSDSGTTWSEITSSRNTYISGLTGHIVGQPGGAGGPTYATVSFDLDAPQTGIDGIRLIGPEGGGPAGGDLGGFIGLAEIEVNTSIAPGADADNDGLPDSWETENGVDDPNADEEQDGLTNIQEFQNGTDPNDADTDDDGLDDGDEVIVYMTDPNLVDSDDDDLSDGDEIVVHMSLPNNPDSDGDGLSDGDEVNVYSTVPTESDSDMDGFSDSIEIAQESDPNSASSTPSNAALTATGIAGLHNEFDNLNALGIPYVHHGNGVIVEDGTSPRLNDGVTEAIALETTVDTWSGGAANTHSYVGVVWNNNPPPSGSVNAIKVTIATFFDGGWFGVNAVTPPGNSPLVLDTNVSAETVPEVQVTSDGGITWTNVDSTSDYLALMDGHIIGNPPTTQTVTWTLATPQAGIDGIRVIGTHGGNAGAAANGFIGATEVEVTTGGAATPLVITDITYTPPPAGNGNGEITLTWASSPDSNYSVFRSSDLSPASWLEVAGSLNSGGESTTFTFENPIPGAAKLFFRVSEN